MLACAPALSTCGNQVLADLPSPDNSKRAVIFVRNCGATTRLNTHISLVQATSPLANEAGNTFVAETGAEEDLVRADGNSSISVQWLGASKLQVNRPRDIRVFREELEVSGVTLDYKILDSGAR